MSIDSSTAFLEDSWVAQSNLKFVKNSVHYYDSTIAEKFKKPWSPDNFGPVKVPANHCFVLGDNRHNAYDSRYRGFINMDSVVSTVLWKR